MRKRGLSYGGCTSVDAKNMGRVDLVTSYSAQNMTNKYRAGLLFFGRVIHIPKYGIPMFWRRIWVPYF